MDFTELPKVFESVAQLEINTYKKSKDNTNISQGTNQEIQITNTQELNSYFENRKPKKKDYENLQWLTGC